MNGTPLSPEEWAMRFLGAVLPFYAPMVSYVLVGIMLVVSAVLIAKVSRFKKALEYMAEAFVKYQKQSGDAIEDASAIQRNFIMETLDIQKKAAAKQEEQMDMLTQVLARFLGQANFVVATPPAPSHVASPGAPPARSRL